MNSAVMRRLWCGTSSEGRVASESFAGLFPSVTRVLAPSRDGGEGPAHTGARNLVKGRPGPYASTHEAEQRTAGAAEAPRARVSLVRACHPVAHHASRRRRRGAQAAQGYE